MIHPTLSQMRAKGERVQRAVSLIEGPRPNDSTQADPRPSPTTSSETDAIDSFRSVARGCKRARSGSPEPEHSLAPSQLSQRLAALEHRMAQMEAKNEVLQGSLHECEVEDDRMDERMNAFAYELDERIYRKWEVYSHSEVNERLGFANKLIHEEMTHLKKKPNDHIFEFDRRLQDWSLVGEQLGKMCTKEQVKAEMEALKASVYTKDQVDYRLKKSFYCKHEADAKIEECMASVYTKHQVDDHLKSFYGKHEVDDQVAHVYVKIIDELGSQIRQRVAQRQFEVMLESIYTKAEIDQKIAQTCTPAAVDQKLSRRYKDLKKLLIESTRASNVACARHARKLIESLASAQEPRSSSLVLVLRSLMMTMLLMARSAKMVRVRRNSG